MLFTLTLHHDPDGAKLDLCLATVWPIAEQLEGGGGRGEWISLELALEFHLRIKLFSFVFFIGRYQVQLHQLALALISSHTPRTSSHTPSHLLCVQWCKHDDVTNIMVPHQFPEPVGRHLVWTLRDHKHVRLIVAVQEMPQALLEGATGRASVDYREGGREGGEEEGGREGGSE